VQPALCLLVGLLPAVRVVPVSEPAKSQGPRPLS
jgi:hypothetical protein